MTERIYDYDSHASSFEAVVLSCRAAGDDFLIELDRTAFFPGGGGQEADRGTLNGQPVLGMEEDGETILHRVKAPLPLGSSVTGQIDFETRFSLMQQHSAEHVCCALLHNRYQVDNIGFHMGAADITFDINGTFTTEEIRQMEKEANRVVASNLSVSVSYPSDQKLETLEYRSKKELTGRVRIVTFSDTDGNVLDRCACCAPHVQKTGEIGLIKILSAEHYKGGTRIHLLAGLRALEYLNSCQDQLHEICTMLSAVPVESYSAVQKLKSQESALKEELLRTKRRMIFLLAAQVQEGIDTLIVFEDLEDMTCAREYVNLMTARREGPVFLFTPASSGFNYIGSTRTGSVKDICREMNQALTGRGGGSDAMVQGHLEATREAIEGYFSK